MIRVCPFSRNTVCVYLKNSISRVNVVDMPMAFDFLACFTLFSGLDSHVSNKGAKSLVAFDIIKVALLEERLVARQIDCFSDLKPFSNCLLFITVFWIPMNSHRPLHFFFICCVNSVFGAEEELVFLKRWRNEWGLSQWFYWPTRKSVSCRATHWRTILA